MLLNETIFFSFATLDDNIKMTATLKLKEGDMCWARQRADGIDQPAKFVKFEGKDKVVIAWSAAFQETLESKLVSEMTEGRGTRVRVKPDTLSPKAVVKKKESKVKVRCLSCVALIVLAKQRETSNAFISESKLTHPLSLSSPFSTFSLSLSIRYNIKSINNFFSLRIH